MTTPPRCFFPLVAVCLIVLTGTMMFWMVSSAQNGRYSFSPPMFAFDTRTGRLCTPNSCLLLTQAGLEATADTARRVAADSARRVAETARIVARRDSATEAKADYEMMASMQREIDSAYEAKLDKRLGAKLAKGGESTPASAQVADESPSASKPR